MKSCFMSQYPQFHIIHIVLLNTGILHVS